MPVRWCAAAAIALLVSSSSMARAQDLPRMKIAVVATNVVNYSAEDANRVTLAISSGLRRVLDVSTRGDLVTQAAAAQAALDLQRCPLNAECIGEMRRALKVDALLLVSLARIGDLSRIDIRYVSPQSSEAVPVIQHTVQDLSADAFAAKAQQIVPDARVRDTPLPAEPQPRTPQAAPSQSEPGRPESPPDPMAPQSSRFTAPVLISGGVTLAALAGGLTFGVLASGHSECNTDPGCARSEADKADREALIADAFLISAGVGAIVTTLLFATAGDDDGVRASVAPTRGGGALVVGGRF